MKSRFIFLFGALAFAAVTHALAEDPGITAPKSVKAGSAFAIECTGTGSGTLYIIGLNQVLKRDVQLGTRTFFPAGSLHNAGQYLVVISSNSFTRQAALEVTPASDPARISFLAEPSRLPVSTHNGITGTAYVFDSYGNLITSPTPVSFTLSNSSSGKQSRSVNSSLGAAWTEMDSTPKQSVDQFEATAGNVSVSRAIRQEAGDPCALKMNARQSHEYLQLETDPVRDCSGNAVPDGTIVTFTESFNGRESTADVPLKHGIAKVDLPAHNGALLSVASGVVLGNQIRWGR
jgi:hypothetical protein